MKVLVAIANHGVNNQYYLKKLLRSYREMPMQVDIVVLSDIPKELGDDVEVLVGAPTTNPWSLPFAHRALFINRSMEYDYFIYSEDDTLLTWEAMQAFIESTKVLKKNEIAGFVRTETAPDDSLYFSTCHSFFHWIPSSVRDRGGDLWAHYTNEHAACYVLSQAQLKIVIRSGGYTTVPHEGRHDMLCAAATDVYTQCGLERLVCIDKINSFSLPHLPNKYIGKMGLPEDEMYWQVEALHQIHNKKILDYELLCPETMLPGGMGSKFYREPPDEFMGEIVGQEPKKIFVWGAGDGLFESDLRGQGHEVSVLPLDAVVGVSCSHRQLSVLHKDFIHDRTVNNHFDVVLFRDVLHLLENPAKLLADTRSILRAGGSIIVRIPNLNDIALLRRRLLDPRFKIPWNKKMLQATPLTARCLVRIAEKSSLKEVKVYTDVPSRRRVIDSVTMGLFSKLLSPYLYLKSFV